MLKEWLYLLTSHLRDDRSPCTFDMIVTTKVTGIISMARSHELCQFYVVHLKYFVIVTESWLKQNTAKRSGLLLYCVPEMMWGSLWKGFSGRVWRGWQKQASATVSIPWDFEGGWASVWHNGLPSWKTFKVEKSSSSGKFWKIWNLVRKARKDVTKGHRCQLRYKEAN